MDSPCGCTVLRRYSVEQEEVAALSSPVLSRSQNVIGQRRVRENKLAVMQSDDLLSRVCLLPQEFRRRGDVSMIDLVRDSGYLRSPSAVTEEHLERYFRANPDAIDSWSLHSMDQRCAPAWYLVEPSDNAGQWAVGYLTANGQRTREAFYSDGAKACASFVKQWLDLIGGYRSDG